MEKQINNVTLSAIMRKKLSSSKKVSLDQMLRIKELADAEISVFFEQTIEDGQYVVHDGYSQYKNRFPDSIGYECFCNEISFHPIEEYGSFSQTVEYILDSITKNLQRFKGRSFCIYLSMDDEADRITVHFHNYYNEFYFSEDIEDSNRPILYVIIQT